MALIRAMNSAVSGLRSHQFRIDMVGDNLANATTTAFKAGRVNFHTMLSQTIKFGTAPSGFLGGVDPLQIGLGVAVAETTKDFRQGELEVTGINTDLAIDGDGFFIMRDETGAQVFSRDGSFSLNPDLRLHNPANGFIVQGVNADLTTFTIDPGAPLEDVVIPVGQLTLAQATSRVVFNGNLNGGGEAALRGTVLESNVLIDNTTGTAATAATLLENLSRLPETGGPPIDLSINPGDVITVSVKKGGRPIRPSDTPEFRFFVGTSLAPGTHGFGTTLGQFMDFLERAIGIEEGNGDLVYGPIRPNLTASGVDGIQVPATALLDTNANGLIDRIQVAGTNLVTVGAKVGDILQFSTGPAAGLKARIAGFTTTSTLNDTIILASEIPATAIQPQVGNQFTIHEPPRVVVGNATTTPAPLDNGSEDGRMRIAGNVGKVNQISDLQIVGALGNTLMQFFERQTAAGESALTTLTVYDSLGTPRNLEVTMILEAKNGVDAATGSPGNLWRFIGESKDALEVDGATGTIQGIDRRVGTGTIQFTTAGAFLPPANPIPAFALAINNNGAQTTLNIQPNFDGVTGFSDIKSSMFLADQDGMAFGVMNDFSIGADGIVTGIFSNGQTRTVAQVLLARFPNVQGLHAIGSNNFRPAANSGIPIVGTPMTIGLGAIRSGVLEASNVDFAREFTTMIISQRAFQANARMISTTDRLLEELVNIL